ncbi:TPA: hypothetical protein U2C93_001894 [Streptococcus suis]|nr:hypothetical protein [Streptococcus suis]HEM6036867.1 hypothetical protein [Streptococcus suis]HEM6053930.1 hypothetical protein [Streptococcus suis]HEM6155072.1 hypothetical protein [Streptococcus suis]HEM6279213.1 hypothetical protein [Streptococcus suis]
MDGITRFLFVASLIVSMILVGCTETERDPQVGDYVTITVYKPQYDEYGKFVDSETGKVEGTISSIVVYETYYEINLEGDWRTYEIDKEDWTTY